MSKQSIIKSYLSGYSSETIEQVKLLIETDQLDEYCNRTFGEAHTIRSEQALYDFAMDIKRKYLRQAPPLRKVIWDDKIEWLSNALGLQITRYNRSKSNIQSRNEIRISSLFKTAPLSILRMIVVHELAHLKEKEHNKSFYKLCSNIEPNYYQLEFGARLFLINRELKTKPN